MKLVKKKLNSLIPYENNPRKNEAAIPVLVESISQCSYIAPSGSNWMTAMKGLTPVDVGRSTELATIKNIEKQMASWGEGSRAIIRVKWAGGNSGHVFNLEQANGKLHVYDAQSNQRVTGVDYLKKYLPYSTLSRTQLVRTDNAEIAENMRFMVKPKSK